METNTLMTSKTAKIRDLPHGWISFVAVALVSFTLLTSCSKSEDEEPSVQGPQRNLLLITVDALRADHLELYGYHRETAPRVNEWFGKGMVFERAYSAEASTAPSVVSLLTGQLPQDHGVRLLYQLAPKRLETVSVKLARAGYQTAAIVSNIALTDEAIGLGRHFHYYDDFVDEKVPNKQAYERGADRTTDATIKWLEEFRKPDTPFFLWVHYMDPHGPYHPPEHKPVDFTHDTPVTVDIERIPEYLRVPGVDDGLEYVDLYDEEIAYADAEIGRLLDAYREMGLVDDSVIIFTADHGESMMDHESWFTHAYQVYEEIIRVPLALIGPGVPEVRIETPVSNRDVAPTLLQAGGLRLTDAEAVRVLDQNVAPKNVYSEAFLRRKTHWRTMIRGDEKWTVSLHHKTQKEKERRYYDLSADADENEALPWQEGDARGDELLSKIKRDKGIPPGQKSGKKINAPKLARDMSPEMLEKFKALGYVDD